MKARAEKSKGSSQPAQAAAQPFFARSADDKFSSPGKTPAPAVQPKMHLSQPDDLLEQQADKTAKRIMCMPASPGKDELPRQADNRLQKTEAPPDQLRRKDDEKPQRKEDDKLSKADAPPDKLQRKNGEGGGHVSDGVSSAVKRSASGGQPLPADVRSYMEPRFGADFGGVRTHSDSNAADLNNQLKARAFTYRDHVFFATDQYQPGTSDGKRLLAHELTHTLQQNPELKRQPQAPPAEKKEATTPAVQRAAAPPAAAPAKEAVTSSETVDLSGGNAFSPSQKVQDEIASQGNKGLEVRVVVKGLTGEGRVKTRADGSKKHQSIGKGSMPLKNPWADKLGGMHVNFVVKDGEISGGYASFKPGGGNTNDWLQALQKNAELLGGLGLKLENLPKPVNKFEDGKLTLGVENLKVVIGGYLDATFSLAVENNNTPKIDASADINVKGVAKGQLKLDNTKGNLAGQISLGVDYKSFSGSALIVYNPDGTVDIGGKAAYNADKLSGEIQFVSTDLDAANKFAKDAIAAAGGKENVQEAPPPGPVPPPKEGKKPRALAATGQLTFHLTEWFAGSVLVVVDGKGQVTVIGKIAPPAEIVLFKQKSWDVEIIKLEAKAYYGIPVVGDLNVFANLSLHALADLGPAKIYNIEILGTYSTDPEIQKSIQISGSINISAYSGIRLRAEGGAGIEILSHDLKFGVGINVDVGVKAYVDARPTIGYRDPGVFFVSGTLDMVAQPMLGLGGDFFIAVETPWWSPLSDHRWVWPLFSKEWPMTDPIGIAAVVKEYELGSGKVPEIELKKPTFDGSKFMSSMVDNNLPDKGGGKGAGGGSFKDDGSIPKPEVPPKKPAPKKGDPKAGTKKGAPLKGGKSQKPDPNSPKEKENAKIFQAAAAPLAALKTKGPFTRAALTGELAKIKSQVKGIDFDMQPKGASWLVTPKAGGKTAKGVEIPGKDVAKDATAGKDERSDERKKMDLDAAVKEATALLDDENKDRPEIDAALLKIKVHYKLASIELVEAPEGEEELEDSIKATINPAASTPKKKHLRKHKSQYVTRKGGKYILKPGNDTKSFIRDKFYGKSYRPEVYTWRDNLVNGKLAHPTDPKLYSWNGKWWDKTLTYKESPTVDHKSQPVVDHWNDEGRKHDQTFRQDYFNDTKGCEVVPYSENSSMGAKLPGSYGTRVTITFRGPGDPP